MRIHVLGTGTSQGVPIIGCSCIVCSSTDPKDKRLRTSVLIEVEGKKIVVDTGPDFRYQMLRIGFNDIDAILMTHEHRDHTGGLDDVRPINFRFGKFIPLFCMERVQNVLKKHFDYVFVDEMYPGKPQVTLNLVQEGKDFDCEGITVTPISVMHGQLPILGFRIANFAYITDALTIADEEIAKLKNLDTLIINALHIEPHNTHMNLEQALAMSKKIGARQTFFTHMSHSMGLSEEVNKGLPPGVSLAFDGQIIDIADF